MREMLQIKPEHKYLEVAERIEALIERQILKWATSCFLYAP
jgi:hypothetical protein